MPFDPHSIDEESWLAMGTPPKQQAETPAPVPPTTQNTAVPPSSDRLRRRTAAHTDKQPPTAARQTPNPSRMFGDDTPPTPPTTIPVAPRSARQSNALPQPENPGGVQKMAPVRLTDDGFETPVQDLWEQMDTPSHEPEPKPRKSSSKKASKPRKQKPYNEKPTRTTKQKILRLVGILSIFVMVFSLVGVIVLGIFIKQSTLNDDLWLDLEQIPYRTASVLTYTDPQTGEVGVYAQLPSTQDKLYVEGGEMPQYLRDAFVAVEDKNFYKHNGFDLKRTIFAALNEVKHAITGSYIGGENGSKQGASTINQQLVKNLTLDDENSKMAGYLRKVREIYRAWKMDKTYDKDTILTAYLNTISFTDNRAGIETEAQRLFGKTTSQLTLAESATLAAIPRNPSWYNPVTHPENNLERRNYILYLMLEQESISQQDYDEAIAQPISVIEEAPPKTEREVTSYFTDTVVDEVVDELMRQRGLSQAEATNLLYNGGLRIHTTVVPELQANMEKTMASSNVFPRPAITGQGPLTDENGNPILDEQGNPVIGDIQIRPEAAMISLDYEGGICAVVGGLGEKEISRGFNRGTSAVRQVGSTMKPISPYITALEAKTITWSTPFLDAPVRKIEDDDTGEMVDWPANVDRYYSKQDILVREAFARSVNTVAVRVGETVGNRAMYRFVHNDLEISSFVQKDAKPGPLVLGSSTYGITPLEMARSYTIFGNGGYLPTVHSITHITNGTGGTLLAMNYPTKQIISGENSFIVNRLMREVVTGDGTASGMSVPGEMDSVGKTGTTSDHRDHWFIGLTPYYVTATWYGYDNNTPLLVNNALHPPTLAWRNVMQSSQQDLPYKDFPTSDGVHQHQYCTVSGTLAGPNCPSATGWYADDNLPPSTCPVHGG